jgi:hypothetical protein
MRIKTPMEMVGLAIEVSINQEENVLPYKFLEMAN